MKIFKKVMDFFHRLLGSSYIVKELYPKGSSYAINDFRECQKCGTVLTLKADSEHGWSSPRKSCGCSFLCEESGILKDGRHQYKVLRLYDFVLWRSIVGVGVLFTIIAPFVLNWHGFGNVFIPENMDISRWGLDIYSSSHSGPLGSFAPLHPLWIMKQIFLVLLGVGILIQLFSAKFKLYPIEGLVLLAFVLLAFSVSVYLPVHSKFSEGRVIPEGQIVDWAEGKLIMQHHELTKKGTGTESHEKAFALADKMFEKAKNVSSQVEWEKRRLDVAVMLVKAYPNKLETYWEVVRYSGEFYELYLQYLNFSMPKKVPLPEHCQLDPWNVISYNLYSSEKDFMDSFKELCENFYEKRRGVSKNKVFGGF